MRSDLTMTYTKIPIWGFGRVARPFATGLDIGQVGDRFASIRRKRAP